DQKDKAILFQDQLYCAVQARNPSPATFSWSECLPTARLPRLTLALLDACVQYGSLETDFRSLTALNLYLFLPVLIYAYGLFLLGSSKEDIPMANGILLKPEIIPQRMSPDIGTGISGKALVSGFSNSENWKESPSLLLYLLPLVMRLT
ncbi:hypothetical protein STEG23_024411, partial [Scotinomys teguina]